MHWFWRAAAVFFVLCQTCAVVCAQPPAADANDHPALPANHRYTFQHVDERLGLGTKTITAFLQDRTGFLWIGTQEGLLRFDGINVVSFGRDEGLPSSVVSELTLGSDGAVWVGTSAGIARFDGQRFVQLQLPNPDWQIQPVLQLFALDQNGIYVATNAGLLWMDHSDSKQFHLLTHRDGLPKGPIDALYFGGDGVLWFAIDNRLGRMRSPGSKPEVLSARTGEPGEIITSILVDNNKMLWVRTSNHLSRFDLATSTFIPDDAGIPKANDFGTPVFDRHGNLLVPSVEGLFRHINDRWEQVGEKQGAASDAVFAALEDDEGAIWLGYGGEGFDRWPGSRRWTGWSKVEGLPDNVVWCALRDHQGRLWIGTNNGLAMWQQGAAQWRVWRESNGLAGNTVRDMALGKDGSVWVLSFPGGLTQVNPNSLALTRVPVNPKGTRDPTRIAVGPDGKIWIGSPQYLKLLHPESKTFVDVALPQEIVGSTSSVDFSADGTLWTAGRHGIARFDGKRWQHFSEKDGLRPGAVTGIAPVSSSEVWFHYDEPFGIGHLQLANGIASVEHFTTKNGLRTDSMYMVHLDSKKRVWAGSNRGLAMLDQSSKWRWFSRADGLLWDDVSDGAFWQEPDGSFLFGTSRGLTHYQPADSMKTFKPPPAVITSARLGARDRVSERNPQASYKERSFSVQFAAPTFRNPEAVRCRYSLDGPESDSGETLLREVHYSSLPAGSYRFIVACRLDAQDWGTPAAFAFSISQPWWEQWWARALEVGLFVWLIVIFIQLRTRKLEAARARLEVAVAARSAELAKANKELREASLTDPLTGVRNRRFFNSTIEADIKQAVRAYSDGNHSVDHRDLILYLIDMDRFKEVNDLYGHQAGDLALIQVAERLARVVRQSDMLIRWGGEEFLIASRGAERKDAQVLAQRILSAISREPFALGDDHFLSRSCSVGWAAFPWSKASPSELSLEEVLKLVDRALYVAKNSGRNQAIGLVLAAESVADGKAEIVEVERQRVRMYRLLGSELAVTAGKGGD